MTGAIYNCLSAVFLQYENEGIVCPPSLKKGVFLTSADDNIDHNPSATAARDSFMALLRISLTTHLADNCLGVEWEVIHCISSIWSTTISSIAIYQLYHGYTCIFLCQEPNCSIHWKSFHAYNYCNSRYRSERKTMVRYCSSSFEEQSYPGLHIMLSCNLLLCFLKPRLL